MAHKTMHLAVGGFNGVICTCDSYECKVSCPFAAVEVAGELVIVGDADSIANCGACCVCSWKEVKVGEVQVVR